MRSIIPLLKQSKVFTDIDVLELVDEGTVQLLRVRARLKDASILFITELHAGDNQKYSYHWQKRNGDIIVRWDNAPHHKELKTFPHHKHEGRQVLPSHRITVDEVIEVLKNKLE